MQSDQRRKPQHNLCIGEGFLCRWKLPQERPKLGGCKKGYTKATSHMQLGGSFHTTYAKQNEAEGWTLG